MSDTAQVVIDLSAPVSAEELHASLQGLWTETKLLARENSWCSSWVSYAREISRWFPSSRHDDDVAAIPEAQPPVPLEDLTEQGQANWEARTREQFRDELVKIRGRILYNVNRRNITLNEANRLLVAGHLPVYEQAAEPRYAYYGYFTFFVTSASDDAEVVTQELEITEELTGKFREALAGTGLELTRMQRDDFYRNSDTDNGPVAEEDTVTPIGG